MHNRRWKRGPRRRRQPAIRHRHRLQNNRKRRRRSRLRGSGFATSYTLRIHVNDATSSIAFVTNQCKRRCEFDVTTPTDSDNTADTSMRTSPQWPDVAITDADTVDSNHLYTVDLRSSGPRSVADRSTETDSPARRDFANPADAIDYDVWNHCDSHRNKRRATSMQTKPSR